MSEQTINKGLMIAGGLLGIGLLGYLFFREKEETTEDAEFTIVENAKPARKEQSQPLKKEVQVVKIKPIAPEKKEKGAEYWMRMDWNSCRDITIQRNIPRFTHALEQLMSDLRDHGITMSPDVKPGLYYYGFNMRDPVVGGYTEERRKLAIYTIQEELRECINNMNHNMKMMEAKRLEQRTYYDIEMMEEIGYCQGVENYSRHFTGRSAGEAPPTLLEYFPEDFLTFIDESHVTVPQIGGMYRGDRSRKMNLVEHGFRLPSALDNRPLNFQEFEKSMNKVLYVSATPGKYEMEKCEGLITEQIIRPTGLLDPVIEIRPVQNQVQNLVEEIREVVALEERVLVTTLTKKSSEDLASYMDSLGIKVKYLHSEIKTVERMEIIKDLRLGVFDVLIGINLLREGLDLPEVSLVAILDADKEGFLRNRRSMIQTSGRAARNGGRSQ